MWTTFCNFSQCVMFVVTMQCVCDSYLRCRLVNKFSAYGNGVGFTLWVLWKLFPQLFIGQAINTILALWVPCSLGNGILLLILFWPTVRKNCSGDREKLLKFEAEGREFAKFLRSLEQFIQTVKGQNIFW